MVEPEVPLKRKDQIALDEQISRDIQAKLDAEIIEEQKLARKQEEEANIALIESWENKKHMIEADRLCIGVCWAIRNGIANGGECCRKNIEIGLEKNNIDGDLIVAQSTTTQTHIAFQLATSREIDYVLSRETPRVCSNGFHYLSDMYKEHGKVLGSQSGCNKRQDLWSEDTNDFLIKEAGEEKLRVDSDVNLLYVVMRWATKKVSAPVFYGPSTQGLLDAYGCDTIEEYLEWNYFPSTDNESTNMETTDKGNTDKDCIDDSNSAMSKASVTTWDEIKKKIGARKSKTCADKAKGKRKVSCGS
ncbi:hypothetical protein Tco_1394112 [Tanacetum coccineum]